MSDEYSVCLFYASGRHEYAERWIGAEEAVAAAKRYTETVGGRTGLLVRVIITDRGDFTCFEWRFGEGVTFPPEDAYAFNKEEKINMPSGKAADDLGCGGRE